MSASTSIPVIHVVGEDYRAWMIASSLAARLQGSETRIAIDMASRPETARDERIVLRPNIRRLHQLLQIPERVLVEQAEARPIHAFQSPSCEGDVTLPFGAYGMDRGGAGFLQYWLRAREAGDDLALQSFNLALAAYHANRFTPEPLANGPSIDFGYEVSQSGYASILQNCAKALGVQQLPSAQRQERGRDILIINTLADIKPTDACGAAWVGNKMFICRNDLEIQKIPGMAAYCIQSAIERLIDVWPDGNFHEIEIAEYNRLKANERDRIIDFSTLLFSVPETWCNSPQLARKVNVFRQRGRIPKEDYEVFSEPEWITVLLARGIFPQGYDRLAEMISMEELQHWFTQLRGNIENAVNAMTKTERH